jgi:ComF family protein
VVHAFKYRGDFFWIGQLTDWLEEGFQRWAATESWDALVPVPLHPLRQRERGFNQAAELAAELKKRIGLPSWDILERQRLTSSQARLERVGRLKNLRRAFRIKSPYWRRGFDVQGKSLLLIDDVFTTGATTEACARVLVRQGAVRVAALTIARG